MRNIFRFAILLGFCLVLGRVSYAQILPPDVAEALTWLPPGSETLAVARGPLTIPKTPAENANVKRDFVANGISSHFFLSNLQLATVAGNLLGRTIESSLEARSNFRPPAALGLMPYDGCGVIRLRPLQGETPQSLRMKLARGATRKAIIAGQPISVFEGKRVYDLWRVYVAVPRPDTILLATTHAQLELVLNRMNGKTTGPRAFPTTWKGWKLVNTSAPFWAIRRFDLKRSMGVMGPPNKDEQGSAFTVESTGKAASSLLLKYQSGDLRVTKKMLDALHSELRTGVSMKKIAPDTMQISVSNPNTNMADFYILAFLGTGVYL